MSRRRAEIREARQCRENEPDPISDRGDRAVPEREGKGLDFRSWTWWARGCEVNALRVSILSAAVLEGDDRGQESSFRRPLDMKQLNRLSAAFRHGSQRTVNLSSWEGSIVNFPYAPITPMP